MNYTKKNLRDLFLYTTTLDEDGGNIKSYEEWLEHQLILRMERIDLLEQEIESLNHQIKQWIVSERETAIEVYKDLIRAFNISDSMDEEKLNQLAFKHYCMIKARKNVPRETSTEE